MASDWKLNDGRTIQLVTPQEFDALPNGTRLVAIDGDEVVKGTNLIDGDTRFGHMAFGLMPETPDESVVDGALGRLRGYYGFGRGDLDPYPAITHGVWEQEALHDADVITVMDGVQSLRTRLAEAEREREAMRRVVEAAELWRDHTGWDWLYPWEAPLRDAVDEYRARPSDPRGLTGGE